jgi:hypothetical protein
MDKKTQLMTADLLRRRLSNRKIKLARIVKDEPGAIGLLHDLIEAGYALALADEDAQASPSVMGGATLYYDVSGALDCDGPHRARALAETLAPIADGTAARLDVERARAENAAAEREQARLAKARERGRDVGFASGFDVGFARGVAEMEDA